MNKYIPEKQKNNEGKEILHYDIIPISRCNIQGICKNKDEVL